MAKKTKKSNAAKTKKTGAKRGAQRGGRPPIMRFAMDTCSVSNPFCPEAVGSRWPDNSFTKSVGWSLSAHPRVIPSNATGAGANLLLPTLQRADGTVTGTTAAFSTLTGFDLPTDVVRWRVTSWGIRVSCPMSKMTAAGTLQVRMVSPMTGASLASVDFNSVRVDASLDVPVSRLIEKELFITPMPLGDNPRWFQTGSPHDVTTLANFVNPGWQLIILGISGAPADTTAVVRYLVYYNMEFVFADGSSSAFFAIAPPPDQPVVRQANAGVLSAVGNFLEGAATTVDNIFKSKAFQFGTRLLGAGMSRNPAMLMDRGMLVD